MDTNLATIQAEYPNWDEWDTSLLKDCNLVIAEDDKVLGQAALTAVTIRCVYASVAEVVSA
jgi:phosphinothricin acetyltransferase